MRICPACENIVAIRNETCTCCGSDLTGRALDRQLAADRRANKALMALTLALLLVMASLAVMVRSADVRFKQDTRALTPRSETRSDFMRETLALHGHRLSPTQHGLSLLSNQFEIVEKSATENTVTTIRVRVRDRVDYDQLHDMAISLARKNPGKKLRVDFWSNNRATPAPQHSFAITPSKSGLTIEYSI